MQTLRPFFLRRRRTGVHDDAEMQEVVMYMYVYNLLEFENAVLTHDL